MKLLQATCKVFFRLCTDKGLDCIYSKGFIMSYDTNIPRMVSGGPYISAKINVLRVIFNHIGGFEWFVGYHCGCVQCFTGVL